jgi:Penicillin-insensitive murein endopeptidase
MTQKVLTSLLLLLICGPVAAEPTHKRTTTAATRRDAAEKQNVKSTPKEPSAEETPVKEPPAKEPPANELFGAAPSPAPLAARAIGSYARGCLAGAVALPINGPDWQVMRLSRNRNWGHPRLLDFLERFAADARNLDGWPGLLVGDMSQPRGGPMITGHSSHQIGLNVDIWLTPMPDRILTPEERENMVAVSMLKDRSPSIPTNGLHSTQNWLSARHHIQRSIASSCTPRSKGCCAIRREMTALGWPRCGPGGTITIISTCGLLARRMPATATLRNRLAVTMAADRSLPTGMRC